MGEDGRRWEKMNDEFEAGSNDADSSMLTSLAVEFRHGNLAAVRTLSDESLFCTLWVSDPEMPRRWMSRSRCSTPTSSTSSAPTSLATCSKVLVAGVPSLGQKVKSKVKIK
jgi:hypothetical protein